MPRETRRYSGGERKLEVCGMLRWEARERLPGVLMGISSSRRLYSNKQVEGIGVELRALEGCQGGSNSDHPIQLRGCFSWSPSEGLLLWVKTLTSLFLRGGFVCYPVPSYIRVDRGEPGGGLLKSGGILKA